MTSTMDLAIAERRDLLDLVTGLDDAQWRSPSLCPDWTVRDVVVHTVSYEGLGWIGLPGAFVRGGLRVDAVNAHVLGRYADLSPSEVVALVGRTQRPRGLTSAFGGGIALTDGMIHQQDIRRSLDLPRPIPAERLQRALDFSLSAPTLPGRRYARGLELVADDLDWVHGRGAIVHGPGEAIMMACAGRAQALAELDGPGLQSLAARVERSG